MKTLSGLNKTFALTVLLSALTVAASASASSVASASATAKSNGQNQQHKASKNNLRQTQLARKQRAHRNEKVSKKQFKHHASKRFSEHRQSQYERYKCYDFRGRKLKGKFDYQQQFLIESGGGSCYRVNNFRAEVTDLYQIRMHDFPVGDVYQAIHQIKHDYAIKNARVVFADNVKAGFRTFKYTLVFQTKGNQMREFRVKHNRRNGNIRAIYEV